MRVTKTTLNSTKHTQRDDSSEQKTGWVGGLEHKAGTTRVEGIKQLTDVPDGAIIYLEEECG